MKTADRSDVIPVGAVGEGDSGDVISGDASLGAPAPMVSMGGLTLSFDSFQIQMTHSMSILHVT